MAGVPVPDPQELVPRLLAFLPTAFASSRPPPDLLPLFSPILRQRISFQTSTSTTGLDSWLRLLCWDHTKAETLKETVENANFEPHPSSGEIEVGDVDQIKFKRYDVETLKAQIPLLDWSLTAVYLWCTGGEDGDGWRLAELLPYDSDLAQDKSWANSPLEADEAAKESLAAMERQKPKSRTGRSSAPGQKEVEDEDDDYWAQYDNTPNRTPATRTPMKRETTQPETIKESEDDEYFARYGSVQPAVDDNDPDEQNDEVGESSLHGDTVQRLLKERGQQNKLSKATLADHDRLTAADDDDVVHVTHPVPSSPSSRACSDTVAKLEQTAERFSASDIAIKQHISTTMKSMYRLARGAGIPRQDFEEMVQRELETLSIFEQDD